MCVLEALALTVTQNMELDVTELLRFLVGSDQSRVRMEYNSGDVSGY